MAVRDLSAESSRLKVQLHWRLCCWSWCTSDWWEVYECQSSAVFLGSIICAYLLTTYLQDHLKVGYLLAVFFLLWLVVFD